MCDVMCVCACVCSVFAVCCRCAPGLVRVENVQRPPVSWQLPSTQHHDAPSLVRVSDSFPCPPCCAVAACRYGVTRVEGVPWITMERGMMSLTAYLDSVGQGSLSYKVGPPQMAASVLMRKESAAASKMLLHQHFRVIAREQF
jgi:hypothetical protein